VGWGCLAVMVRGSVIQVVAMIQVKIKIEVLEMHMVGFCGGGGLLLLSCFSFLKRSETSHAGGIMHYYKREDLKRRRNQDFTTIVWGWILIVGSFLIYASMMFWMIFSKFMPDTGNAVIDWIKYDHYYCYVIVVALFPVLPVFIYSNWLSLKFFRHN
jgi:hypothetical protein